MYNTNSNKRWIKVNFLLEPLIKLNENDPILLIKLKKIKKKKKKEERKEKKRKRCIGEGFTAAVLIFGPAGKSLLNPTSSSTTNPTDL